MFFLVTLHLNHRNRFIYYTEKHPIAHSRGSKQAFQYCWSPLSTKFSAVLTLMHFKTIYSGSDSSYTNTFYTCWHIGIHNLDTFSILIMLWGDHEFRYIPLWYKNSLLLFTLRGTFYYLSRYYIYKYIFIHKEFCFSLFFQFEASSALRFFQF